MIALFDAYRSSGAALHGWGRPLRRTRLGGLLVLFLVGFGCGSAEPGTRPDDVPALCLAVPWQLTLFLTAMMVVTREWLTVAVLAALLIALTVGLYVTWYRHLSVSEASSARVSAATADLSER